MPNPNDNLDSDHSLLQAKATTDAVNNLETPLEAIAAKTAEVAENTKPKDVQKIEIQGAQLVTIKGEKGEKGDLPSDESITELIKPLIPEPLKGDKGDNPTNDELLKLITPLIPAAIPGPKPTDKELLKIIKPLIPEPVKGEDGETPTTAQLKALIKPLIPKAVPGSPDTAEDIIKKIKGKYSFNDLSEVPTFLGRQSSKTVSLVELDDVDLSGVTKTNGKYVLGGGSGSGVSTVSVTSANGFGGSVLTPTTTPAITITTSVTGLLKGNGTGVVAAAAGTDYEVPLTFSSPLVRTTNTISIPPATTSANGYLTSTDWNTFNAKQATITLTTVGTSGPATLVGATLNVPNYSSGSGGITRSITAVSTATAMGATAATDYVYFVSGTTTMTLPTAVGNTNRYTVVHTDTSTMTIATTSAQTIAFYPQAPATTATVTVRGTVVELYSDGANWWTI